MEYLFLWFLFGLIVSIIANYKGRDSFFAFLGWFIYGFLLFPVALVHVIVIGPTAEAEKNKAIAAGRVPCPFCAEMIKKEAKVCPHCQRDLK